MNTLKTVSLCLFILLGSFTTFVQEQIHGNGEIVPFTMPIDGISYIDIQFNADITIDYNKNAILRIEADQNIIPFIGRTFDGRTLTLDQIKWVEPSKQPIIHIGVQHLKGVYQGTHSPTWITHIDKEKLIVNGNVGQVYLNGKVGHLKVEVSGSNIDASKLDITKADIKITGSGKVTLDKVKDLKADINEDSKLIRLSEPLNYIGMSKNEIDQVELRTALNSNLQYIDFKIKNNSWNRNHFIVVGLKKDGSTFSYGFPMMPYSTKEERRTIRTKIYQENRLGKRILLTSIEAADENQVVNLFE